MRLFVIVPLLLLSCGSTSHPPNPPSAYDVVFHKQGLATNHLGSCDDPTCGGGDAFPVGGPHCNTTLPCRIYAAPESRCHWVHNLEHGHAVLLYNCPNGCPDEVTAMQTLWQQRQADPVLYRMVVVPDASLPRRFAAAVWGWGWVSDTYDAQAIDQVLQHQDSEAPEAYTVCAR